MPVVSVSAVLVHGTGTAGTFDVAAAESVPVSMDVSDVPAAAAVDIAIDLKGASRFAILKIACVAWSTQVFRTSDNGKRNSFELGKT